VPVAVVLACGGKSPTDATPAANTVTFGNATATVAIASTKAARERGLMNVTQMAADSGMLFVFAYMSNGRAFWMKNTPIPLSIAFLDSAKKVVYLAEMAANDTIARYGGFNAPRMQYALEMNKGWFTAHGVTIGAVATFTLPAGLVIETDP